MVLQAAICDSLLFDPFALEEDGLAAPEVDVGRGEIVDALVIAPVVVQRDDGTPTGPKNGKFCMSGIRGLVGLFTSTR